VYNALFELDRPGEYVVDHGAKTAFVYPPAAAVRGDCTAITSDAAHDSHLPSIATSRAKQSAVRQNE
jgi:hypothetical protein